MNIIYMNIMIYNSGHQPVDQMFGKAFLTDPNHPWTVNDHMF